MIDWDEPGTLSLSHGAYTRQVRTDPLWILVTTAWQGHEGDWQDMAIEIASGVKYGPEDIRRLAGRADRKRS